MPGNSQGIYTGTTTSRQTLLSPYPGLRLQRHQHHREYRLLLVSQLPVHRLQALRQGLHRQGSYTFSEVDAGRQSAECLRPRAGSRNLRLRRAAPHQHLAASGPCPSAKAARFLHDSNGFVSRLVGGWEVSGIWSIQSGFALPWGNVIYYGDPANIQLPLDQRTPEHWFNVANFETASAKQLLGNQVRTWPLPLLHAARTPPEQRRHRVDQADPDLRRQEPRVPCRSPQRRQPPVLPNPNMTVTAAAERQGHGLRADQRLHP